MEYTKAINLMSGEIITITEKEFLEVDDAIKAKDEWVRVQGQLINTKAIAKIGNHHATSEVKKYNGLDLDRRLIEAGRRDLVDAKRKLVEEKTINRFRSQDELVKRLVAGDPEAIKTYNSQNDEPKRLKSGTDEAGDYWLDEAGVKNYN